VSGATPPESDKGVRWLSVARTPNVVFGSGLVQQEPVARDRGALPKRMARKCRLQSRLTWSRHQRSPLHMLAPGHHLRDHIVGDCGHFNSERPQRLEDHVASRGVGFESAPTIAKSSKILKV
jgi:hypothetical protein